MNKIVKIAAATLVILSVVLWAGLLVHPDFPAARTAAFPAGQSVEALGRATKRGASILAEPELAINQTRDVDIGLDERTMAELTPREIEDQYLDWLLMAAVFATEKSVEAVNRDLFDLPTIRIGYTKPIGNFEFDDTRSRMLSDGTVLALVPASQSADERKDALAGIADEWRKNKGQMFERLHVIEYRLDVLRGSASLTRRADIEATELFSAGYGYFEKPVGRLEDLSAFMVQVDDLTSVVKTSDGLVLGGRRLKARRPGRIDIEQIATVWQSEHEIQAARDVWEAHEKHVEDQFHDRWADRTYTTESELEQLKREQDADLAQVKARLAEEFAKQTLLSGSGFSLDPDRDYRGLKAQFDKMSGMFSGFQASGKAVLSQADISNIDSGLANRDPVPLLEIIDRWKSQGEEGGLLADLLEGLTSEYTYQAARYDGSLKGTEAGMVLFYTDLLAKLWVINYGTSAPVEQIVGFLPGTGVHLSRIYREEQRELPGARLWFGHSDLGFQVGSQSNSLLLGRIATRIYAAGNNPLRPGVEVQTSQGLMAPIDWWNDHYAEVARYEPQYERLNEIMKWSIAIGWLNKAGDGERLGYLSGVQIDRTKVFPDWAQKHPELRFSDWRSVGFYSAGYKGTTTEALPQLKGPTFDMYGETHWLEGGVSLAKADVFEGRLAVRSEFEASSAARSNIDYAHTKGTDFLQTFEGAKFEFDSSADSVFDLTSEAKEGTKLRGMTVQLADGPFKRTLEMGAGALRFSTRASDIPLGDLAIEPGPNGFEIGWSARELDEGSSLARLLGRVKDSEAALKANPQVQAYIRYPGEWQYAVLFNDSNRWVRIAAEDDPGADIAAGWHARSATDDALRNLQVAVFDAHRLNADIAKGGHLVLVAGSDGSKPTYLVSVADAPAGARTVSIDTAEGEITGWVDPSTHSIHVTDLPKDLDIGKLLRAMDSETIANVIAGAPKAGFAEMSLARADLIDAFDRQNFAEAAERITADPPEARAMLDRTVAEETARNNGILFATGPNAALHHIDSLIAHFGPRPDLMLKRGLIEIARNKPSAAAATVARLSPKAAVADRDILFSEINRVFDMPGSQSEETAANLNAYARFVDWRSELAREPASRDLGDILIPASDDHGFHFDFQLSSLPQTRYDPRLTTSGHAAVYVQDTPSLNLDWSASVERTLDQVVSGKIGRVIVLPRSDVAHFRPSAIWNGDHTVSYHNVSSPHGASSALHTGYNPWNGTSSQSCNNTEASCQSSAPPSTEPNMVLVVEAVQEAVAQP